MDEAEDEVRDPQPPGAGSTDDAVRVHARTAVVPRRRSSSHQCSSELPAKPCGRTFAIQSSTFACTSAAVWSCSVIRTFDRLHLARPRLHWQQQVYAERSLQHGAGIGVSSARLISSCAAVSSISASYAISRSIGSERSASTGSSLAGAVAVAVAVAEDSVLPQLQTIGVARRMPTVAAKRPRRSAWRLMARDLILGVATVTKSTWSTNRVQEVSISVDSSEATRR